MVDYLEVLIAKLVISQESSWDVERVLLVSLIWFVLGVCHGTGICACVLFSMFADDFVIMLGIIGLGMLSLTGLCTNCHGYVLRAPVNAR